MSKQFFGDEGDGKEGILSSCVFAIADVNNLWLIIAKKEAGATAKEDWDFIPFAFDSHQVAEQFLEIVGYNWFDFENVHKWIEGYCTSNKKMIDEMNKRVADKFIEAVGEADGKLSFVLKNAKEGIYLQQNRETLKKAAAEMAKLAEDKDFLKQLGDRIK